MMPPEYRYGVRVERIKYATMLGIGVAWYGQKGLFIDFLVWEIFIGKVYK